MTVSKTPWLLVLAAVASAVALAPSRAALAGDRPVAIELLQTRDGNRALQRIEREARTRALRQSQRDTQREIDRFRALERRAISRERNAERRQRDMPGNRLTSKLYPSFPKLGNLAPRFEGQALRQGRVFIPYRARLRHGTGGVRSRAY